mmetsp:Transcript_3927/g.6938  ORF Transcript_3927/g.6938 Transcript_3927/m.6938 type:complete len:92 (+) Transcript_3927:73-348(+)
MFLVSSPQKFHPWNCFYILYTPAAFPPSWAAVEALVLPVILSRVLEKFCWFQTLLDHAKNVQEAIFSIVIFKICNTLLCIVQRIKINQKSQ